MELTQTVNMRDMQEQLLDSMALERERGVTIILSLHGVQLLCLTLRLKSSCFYSLYSNRYFKTL